MALPAPTAVPLDPLDANLEAQARKALLRALDWVLRRQSDDGAFRGRVYPVLSSGQSLTPLVLWTLLELPPGMTQGKEPRLERAQQWILDAQEPSGALGFRSKIKDYPCYATSFAIRCTARLQPAHWRTRAGNMASWLQEQQFREGNGWAGHGAEGGWGMGSEEAPVPPDAGHVDLSMTRCAIEALRDLGTATDGAVLKTARSFVLRSMVSSGGFFYSPVLPRLNKGVATQDGPGPYGSATCDGLMALAALGYPAHHPVFRKSLRLLQEIHVVHENPGVDPGPLRALGEAMKGYYRAGSAQVFQRFGGPTGWRGQMIDAVVAEQRRAGSWLNKNRLLNEDEPLLATLFAMQSLSGVLRAVERDTPAAPKAAAGSPG